jgi:hypothetical protein
LNYKIKVLFFNFKTIFKQPQIFFEELILPKILYRLTCDKYKFLTISIISTVLKINKDSIIFISPAIGTLNVITDAYFYKIGIIKRIIFNEYNNNQFILKDNKIIELILPVKYKKKYFFHILSSKILNNIDSIKNLEAATSILQKITTENKKYINISDLPEVVSGIEIVNLIYGKQTTEKILNILQFALDKPYNIGPAHGDFHQENIMQDELGNIIMIDLDCYRKNGIQALDALYYIIEAESRKNGEFWFVELCKIYKSKERIEEYFLLPEAIDINELLFICFLDRIGQERKYSKLLRKYQINQIEYVISYIFKNQYKEML